MSATQNRENSMKKLERLSKKSIHNLTDPDNPLNHRRITTKESRGNTNIRRFLQGIRYHTERKNEANITGIWSLQRICQRYNDALQKPKSCSTLFLEEEIYLTDIYLYSA